jgi:hypothetical protein
VQVIYSSILVATQFPRSCTGRLQPYSVYAVVDRLDAQESNAVDERRNLPPPPCDVSAVYHCNSEGTQSSFIERKLMLAIVRFVAFR